MSESSPRKGDAQNVTQPTDANVIAFIDAVEHPARRRDALTLLDLMERVTGEPPRMWGPSIVGFGTYHYSYPSGRQGTASAAGFSPRKAATTVYFLDGFEAHAEQLAALGEHTLGKSCLYIKDLATVDLNVLERMIRASYEAVRTEGFGTR